jgi:hypothetical protein
MPAARRSLLLVIALGVGACSDATPPAGSSGATAGASGAGTLAGAAGGASVAGSASVAAGAAAGHAGANGNAGGAGSGGTGGGAGMAMPGAILDPTCWDGVVYAAEPVPEARASIEDLIPLFTIATRTAWSIQVLERRYPNGAEILRGATMDDPNGEANCFGIAYQPDDGWEEIVDGLRTSVHECGHMMDLQFGRYMIRPDLVYECQNDDWDGSPMRSAILDDEFEVLGPTGGTLDFQEEVYLQPTGTGNGGDQRFYLLFTEFHQYINTLATSHAVYDYAPDDIIAGDASRDFAWFLQRYLRILRASYPAEYEKVAGDECWRKLVLAAWGKVNRYWDESQGLDRLVSEEAAIVDDLIRDPRLLAEIEELRVRDGCRAP